MKAIPHLENASKPEFLFTESISCARWWSTEIFRRASRKMPTPWSWSSSGHGRRWRRCVKPPMQVPQRIPNPFAWPVPKSTAIPTAIPPHQNPHFTLAKCEILNYRFSLFPTSFHSPWFLIFCTKLLFFFEIKIISLLYVLVSVSVLSGPIRPAIANWARRACASLLRGSSSWSPYGRGRSSSRSPRQKHRPSGKGVSNQCSTYLMILEFPFKISISC